MTTLIAPVDHGNPRANARELTRFINEAKLALSLLGGKTSARLNVKTRPTSTRQRNEPEPAVISELTTDDVVGVIGEDGYFFFNGVAKNGDVKLYGGADGMHEYRAFTPDRILKTDLTAADLRERLRNKRQAKKASK